MTKKITLIFLLFCFLGDLSAQIVFSEDFNGNGIPADWQMTTLATDGGWNFGTASSISSGAFPIPNNGTNIAGTNDDACNCDKSQDYLITPFLDFSGSSSGLFLAFDIYFGKLTYQGATESAYVEISLDSAATWTVLENLGGTHSWETYTFDISAYQGMENVLIAFHYNDGGGWTYGMAIDDVVIYEPLALDAEMAELYSPQFLYEVDDFQVTGLITNKGFNTIESFDLYYSIDNGPPVFSPVSGVSIEPLESWHFDHPTIWNPGAVGAYDLRVWVENVNGTTDLNPDNDELNKTIDVFEFIYTPNIIDQYIEFEPVFFEIGNASNNLDQPTDLDFHTVLAKRELWVINANTEATGGSTTTFYNAGTTDQDYEWRRDGNAWHFMSLPTGIAFSNNGNFASSAGVQDANHNNGTFTGPTLWSSDPAIYAQPSGGNGSHLDMLHGSPFGMGITNEVDNAFWIFDGWNKEIVRYDFALDHGPGNDDHSDGIVRRFSEYQINMDEFIPSHLVLDPTSNWLYFANVGDKEVVRLDISTGEAVPSALVNEQLAEHSNMINTTFETIITDSLDQPCGVEIMQNRLLVSDYATGDIIIYDIENDFEELHRIATGDPGITGLKIGPDGFIWYTNKLLHTVNKVEPSSIVKTVDPLFSANFEVSPNPTSDYVTIQVSDENYSDDLHFWLTDLDGKMIWREKIKSTSTQVNLKELPKGTYLLTMTNHRKVYTEKIIVQ